MSRNLALILIATLFAGVSLADDKTGERHGANPLIGTYVIVSGERSGAKIPDEEIRGATVTFTADHIAGMDKDKKEFYAATYTMNSISKPIRITMTSTTQKAGETATGIVEVDKDTLKICYNLPGGQVPTEFKTKEKQQFFLLKRTKAAGKK